MTTKNHGTFLQKDTDNHPSGINPIGIELTDQTLDPSGGDLPSAGDYVFYTKSGLPNLIDSSGTVTPVGATGLTTPAIVLGTAAAAGVALTSIASDSTIVAFDVTVPVTQAMGDSAATGSAVVASRRDHKHGMPAFGTTTAAVGTSAGGSATTPSKSDHVHATGAGTPSTQAIGDAAATGTGPAAAMTDHKHAITNPLTTQDDLWVAGVSGAPGRLAKGTNGQVLTVDPSGSHHLIWATPSSGFANPMTTKGDIILADTGGTPERLAVGTDTYVLTADSGSTYGIHWAPGGSGSSPLTTKGDLYGYSTTDARIPIGTDTYVLTADSGQALGLKWAAAAGGGNVSTVSATTIDYGRANLYVYPAVNGTYGDAFDAGTLDAKWTAYVGNRTDWSTTLVPGWAACNAGSGATALIQAIPGGDWTIECEVIPEGLSAAAYQDTGLIVTSGSATGSSTDMRLGVGMNNSRADFRISWEKYVNGSFNSGYANAGISGIKLPVYPIYLRLVFHSSAVTFDPYWSPDRLAWYFVDTLGTAPGFTPAYFGISCARAGTDTAYFNYFDKVA